MTLVPVLVPDSHHFTPEGRRLLRSIGALEPDPLRVEAGRWLAAHTGPQTPAVRKVREQLGSFPSPELVALAESLRAVK